MSWRAVLLAVLLVACGGRSFEGAAAEAGASTPVEHDAGGAAVAPETPADASSAAAQTEEPIEPEAGFNPASLSAPLVTALQSAERDAGAPEEPPEAEAPTPPARPPDAGHEPHAPEAEEYFYGLTSRGFSLDACNGLVRSVSLCCSEGGSAFECDRDGCWCLGTQRKFAKASALCVVAPAVPLSWECSP